VQTPSTRWQEAAAVTGPRSSPAYARERYFRGDYDRAISAYQSYIASNPGAGGAPREELAWVYAESGRRGRALEEYKQALNQYQSDLQRGHNLEAARHGARTCESAIKALEVR
jgi:tetratricopeptide (TPR) repeat protein